MHLSGASSPPKRTWKGKERATTVERDGSGGSEGVVLPLQLLEQSMYQSVYTLPVLVGGGRQNLSLQVDTGSADLWIASTSCSTSSCGGTGGHLYDPSTSTPATESFSLTYLRGSVSGDVVWDAVEVGGYNITRQALAAASSVNDEPLTSQYSGILGLALPSDSSIFQSIGTEDSQAFAANLFSMASSSSAPSAPFLSLALERPGSSDVPSVLGVGLHPHDLVPDPSKVEYDDLVSTYNFNQFWAASVKGITVWVQGEAKNVTLGISTTGAPYPTAVLDSGTPVILASPAIASAIYNTIGISPASDGTYYIPCNMPLNMTITLDDRSEIPLHPLDLSTYSQTAGSYCMSMIQSTNSFNTPGFTLPDIVLGVPFLRNTYMVMAYEHPSANGSFTSQNTFQEAGEQVNPQLGLLSLTNITQAMLEFNQTRLNSASGGTKHQGSSSHKKLPVGVDVLLGCIGFLVLCGLIFGARWLYYRRRWRKTPTDSFDADSKDGIPDVMRYTLARHNSTSDRYSMAESAKSHSRRPPALSDVPSYGTDRSSFTHVGSGSDGEEFGFRKAACAARSSVASWDSFYADPTLGGGGGPYPPMRRHSYTRAALDSPPDSPGLPDHERHGSNASTSGDVMSPEGRHRRLDSEDAVAVPLLVHTRSSSAGSAPYSEDIADVPPHRRARSPPPSRRPANERMSSFTLADWEAQQGHEGESRDSWEQARHERARRPSFEAEPMQPHHHHRHHHRRGSSEQSAGRHSSDHAHGAQHDRTLPHIPVGEPILDTSNLGI